ncbi:MAG TPA: antibiotic biosynthesis monooxygenase family protein [Flavobacteriaceae bacterium]|nr:antibiotic biosynthesis monooxygenase [Flavobacteriaceae bacterium]HEX5742466.1 antibiotic biosynthesis monooxygenase family protein [Flavobacteriaceae bacterium]
MLIRIVKMSFQEDQIPLFLSEFEQYKTKIRNVKGCQFLELYRDINISTTYFTYSYWDSETDLNLYRDSELFKEVWGKTKILFNQKPQAWSVETVVSLP